MRVGGHLQVPRRSVAKADVVAEGKLNSVADRGGVGGQPGLATVGAAAVGGVSADLASGAGGKHIWVPSQRWPHQQ